MPKQHDTPRQLFMFEESPVTWPQIWDWVESVARISRDSWRAKYYAEHWQVAEKIRAARGDRQA